MRKSLEGLQGAGDSAEMRGVWKTLTTLAGEVKSPEADALRAALVERERKPLPDGWTEFLDAASRRPYYHHAASGKTQWRRPEISAQEAAELPRGWKEFFDAKRGLPYFHHAASGKTQWARPAVGDVVAADT